MKLEEGSFFVYANSNPRSRLSRQVQDAFSDFCRERKCTLYTEITNGTLVLDFQPHQEEQLESLSGRYEFRTELMRIMKSLGFEGNASVHFSSLGNIIACFR